MESGASASSANPAQFLKSITYTSLTSNFAEDRLGIGCDSAIILMGLAWVCGMSLTDGKSWWEENQARTRQVLASCFLAAFAVALILFYSSIKDFLSSHHWWEDTPVALAGIAVPVLAYFELRHSGEANELRRKANEHRATANRLQERIGKLEAEKAQHLGKIAANTQRAPTQADVNAEIFRKYLRQKVSVSEGNGVWSDSPEIVEVNNNIVTLFCPRNSSSMAWCVQVYCGDVEPTEIPDGSRPLRAKVNKRHGPNVQLGEITKWEDRLKPAAAPVFDKGGVVYQAAFNKPGSPETRSLHIFASKDGRNEFLLEASTGEKVVADNVGISKRFAIFEIDYRAAGFNRNQSGTGASPFPLFIR